MAIQVNASGATLVKIKYYGGSYQSLGYAVDQPRVTDEASWVDVHGDQHGGPEGPPIEVQYLGGIKRIRMELSRFDRTVANDLRKRIAQKANSAYGTVADADIGAMEFQGNQYLELALSNGGVTGSIREARHFVQAIPRAAIEQGYGTKFSTLMCEFEAHRRQSDGVIEDTNISEKMFRWLFQKREDRRRGIFRYHDGARWRRLDPVIAARDIDADPAYRPDVEPKLIALANQPGATKEQLAESAQALGVTLACVQRVFGLKSLQDDGAGLTSAEIMDVYWKFLSFVMQLKKNTEPSLTAPSSMGATSSASKSATTNGSAPSGSPALAGAGSSPTA